jgi:hypothetical protein
MKTKKVTWMRTQVILPNGDILMIFVNQLYEVPDVLNYKGKKYWEAGTKDCIKGNGILRKIFLKEI